MPTNVVMPQMGESVAEGTVVRWIKQVGDQVDRDEPLFEISTDKVDAEIPSPSAGTLIEIRVREGETVPVDSVVAVLAQPGEARPGPALHAPAGDGDSRPVSAANATELEGGAQEGTAIATEKPEGESPGQQADRLRRQKSSPLVRRIAREHDVDLAQLSGSGIAGRVTKQDILRHIEQRDARPATAAAASAGPSPAQASRAVPVSEPAAAPVFKPGERVQVVPMSVMRRKIAEHMILSKRTSAHVHSVFEVDFHRLAQIRDTRKADYERAGARLTYMAFIARAVCDALRAVPVMNASVDGDNVVYRQDINLGIAVALDWGLIVPVVKNADEKNLLGLARAIADIANRARAKQLKPEEVQGGTFTITNPGVFGTLFGMPIINQPQVAILGVGAIEKRVVVTDDDAIAIRPRAYISIGYDHRLVDGAVADQFMQQVKRTLENFDPSGV